MMHHVACHRNVMTTLSLKQYPSIFSFLEISPRILDLLAQGVHQHGLYSSVAALANELNVKNLHQTRECPKSKWLSMVLHSWQKDKGKDASLLTLLSAIVRVRKLGRIIGKVSQDYGLFCIV